MKKEGSAISEQWPPEIAHLPVDPKRGLPIPYIVEQPPENPVNFGVLDPHRARRCYEHRLCAMCSLPMGKEVALYGDVVALEPGGFYIEAPVHERCLEIALGGLCPFISRESYPRRRQDDPQVAVLGDRSQLREVGRTIAKRPAIMAITEHYQMAMMVHPDGMMPVYLTPRGVIRVRRFGWADGIAREVTGPAAGRAAEPARTVRHQPRRLPRSKRQGPARSTTARSSRRVTANEPGEAKTGTREPRSPHALAAESFPHGPVAGLRPGNGAGTSSGQPAHGAAHRQPDQSPQAAKGRGR